MSGVFALRALNQRTWRVMVEPTAPWEIPAFRRWLQLRVFGAMAAQIQFTAIGWWVYEVTGDTLDLAWVGLAQFLPVLTLSLFGGQLADRYDRRLVLGLAWLTQALCAVGFATLSAQGYAETPLLFALCFLMGTGRALGNPSGQAIAATLVPPALLSRAVAASTAVFQASTLIGPSLCGGLIAWTGGATAAFTLAAIFPVISALGVATLPLQRSAPRAITVEALIEGLRFAWDSRMLFACISLDLFAVLLGGATALLPVVAADVLKVGAEGYGILRAAPAVGAGVVALGLAWRPMERHVGPRMLLSVAGFGAATVVFGLSTSFPLSLAALVALGACDMVSVVIRQTLVQLYTPDEMRGRISAVNLVFIGASNELGEFESGLTARLWGVVRAVVFGGVGTLMITGIWALIFPELRRTDRVTDHRRN